MTTAKYGHNKGDQTWLRLCPVVHFHIKSWTY